MYRVDYCLSCGGKSLRSKRAIVSPFLAAYVVRARPFLCKLLECSACNLRFFDVRLDDAEVDRLYSGYRGEEYFRQRHRQEFWYSRALNDGIGGDPEEIVRRISSLETLLATNVDTSGIHTVLDFGGDKGQFIPPSLGRERFVFEISDATPVSGVTKINSETELSSRKYDLIMLFGVLEHCSDPSSILRKLARLLARNGLLCVGVPHERYRLTFVSDHHIYGKYLRALTTLPPLLRAVDLYSTIGRIRFNRIYPFGLLKCHEHLNFFDDKSLRTLLGACGFTTLHSSLSAVAKYPSRSESLTAITRLRPDS